MGNPMYLWFVDGTNRHTMNLSSKTWVIYYPSSEFLVTSGTCIGLVYINMAEYNAIIELILK